MILENLYVSIKKLKNKIFGFNYSLIYAILINKTIDK